MTGEKTELSAAKQMLLEKRLQGALRSTAREPMITRATHGDRAPLSFAQQRLWFLEQLSPGSAVYNIAEALRLHGTLDTSALERSLQEIVRRHEALRTNFVAVDGQPVQVIKPAVEFGVKTIDLRALAPLEREPELRRLTREETARPFDLTRDLMLRATLFRLTPTEHVLLLTMHHIASDAWSIGVLYQELSVLYQGFSKGKPGGLADLAIQYADFAVWQREWMQGKTLDRELAYWKEQLAGAPEVMNLPTDHPRPPRQTFRGTRCTLVFPAGLSQQLKELSHAKGVTLFMTLLTAFKALLHRYTRQDDIVVDSPIAGRGRMETEPLIGFFVNTLVLRTRLSGQTSFNELLESVRKTTLEAYAHQELPFEKLIEHLQPERSLSMTPFVQTMFVVQNALSDDLRLPGIVAAPLEVDNGTAKFDLTLTVLDQQSTLAACMEYNTDLYDETTINRMLSHYQVLLEAVVENPDRAIGSLPLLTGAERHQLLTEWNNTSAAFPREVPVHRLFEAQVERNPGAVAIVDGGVQLTYEELNGRANQLARRLQRAGVAPGKFVGVYLDRSADLIATLLAILKCGAAYVPLDQSYPGERIAFMLDDAQLEVLVTESRFTGSLPTRPSTTCVYLDREWDGARQESGENLAIDNGGGTPAYVIYTSGSTGKPKGVIVPHRGISRLVINTDYLRLGPDDVVPQISNCSFDAATWEIWGPLLNGARLVILSKETAISTADFAASIRSHGITTMFMTTALFNQHASQSPAMFRPVRHVLIGGEALDAGWVREVFEHGAPQRFLNVYGPTETTTFATWFEVSQLPDDAMSAPIGRPIANTTTYILDERQQPVPIGVPGELYVGGDGVALGYLDRPELTRERFVKDPFSTNSEARLYRTGDLVRYLPSGAIEFLGRIDQQVKIRGFRVELGEIEAVLGQHPAVRQCAVAAHSDGSGPKRLTAYLVPKNRLLPDSADLRAYVAERLPEYMVPSFFVPVSELPLSPNGKVNRAALPVPERGTRDLTGALVAPQDEVESTLQTIWQRVLGVPQVSMRDKFFELGGHSLLAVRLVAEIEKVWGRKISVATIFQYPTIAQLATVLRDRQTAIPSSSVVEIQPKGSRPPIFFVHGVGGGMFWGYTNLARHLGDDQPVYALRARGLAGEEEFSSIDEMAAQYVADLRAFQPKGPYYLGGYCFGGNVAYEMARILEAQGEKVGIIALLNSAPPNSSYSQVRWTPAFALKFSRNLVYWTKYAITLGRKQRPGFIRWKLATLAKALRRRLLGEETDEDANNWVDLSVYPEEERPVWEAHIRALMQYYPKPYNGMVTLFRSSGHPFLCSFDSRYGWGELAVGGVDVHIVSGYHESILEEPHVGGLAREMTDALRKAQTIHEPARPRTPPAAPPAASRRKTIPVPVRRPEQVEAPLTFAQETLWKLGPGHANVATAILLEGAIDVPALERSLSFLVERHAVLRTRFVNGATTMHQEMTACARVKLERVEATDTELADKLEEAASRRFDLATVPLLRAVLFRLGVDRHVLLLASPALAADDHSLYILQGDLAEYYNAQLSGRAPDLLPVPVEYSDFAVWERQGDEVVCEAPRHVPPGPELPVDHPAPVRRTWRARVERMVLNNSIFAALKKLSQREAITLFLTVLAATGSLLYRHSRQDSFAVSTPVSGRTRTEIRSLIGLFSNVRLVHQDVSGNPTFRELLQRRRRDTDQQTPGFVESGLRVMVSLENLLDPLPDWTGLKVREQETGLKLVPFDLGFRFIETAQELLVECTFNADLFEPISARRWLARLQGLLEAVSANPDQRLGDLPLLPESERQQVVRDWNATAVPFCLKQGYPKLFEAQVEAHPEAPAVRHENEEWTYGELNRRANLVARHLQKLGAGPEMLVGICMERSLEMASALLGVLKSGAAYLPLDPAYPQERLEHMLSDSGVQVVLTQNGLISRLSSPKVKLVSLDDGQVLEQGGGDENRASTASPDNLAYVIYTSGSTGKSKGVEVTGGSLLNHSLAMGQALGLGPADRVLQFTALSFDVSIEEMLPSWLKGCTVVLRTEEALASIGQFLRFIEAEGITVLNVPTAFWHALVDSFPAEVIPQCVRLVVIGGEKASLPHYQAWKRHVGDRIQLINAYGLTETTVTNTIFVSEPGSREDSLPIGRPIANTRAYILDSSLEPVPVGMSGELYIGGEGVARGYLKRPELTAERFPNDPFTTCSRRLYKTGDLARFLPDGNIELIGRSDEQVKVRGFRVEVAEVETALLQHPKVRQCVVGARVYGGQEKRLLAWLVPQPMDAPTTGELISFLKKRLPDYMIPSAFVAMESFPLLPNGKMDRVALPLPGPQRPELENRFEAPRDAVEEQVAMIWRDVLGIEKVGINDNFFDLGGHSLHAMQAVARMGETFKMDVPLSSLFQTPTIALLAGLLTASGRQRRSRGPKAVPASERTNAAPLSFAQQRLWFLHQLEPDNPVYNLPHTVHIEGKLDLTALESAFLAVISRHEALRTALVIVDGEPRQQIFSVDSFKLPFIDLAGDSQPERSSKLERLAREEGCQPFDLSRDLMVRAKVARLGESEHVLIVTFHHVASDGWSVEIFWGELFKAYEAFTSGQAPDLPPLPVRYVDFSEWQRNWLRGDVLNEEIDYWKAQLADAPALLELPTDHPRPASQSNRGARVPVQFSSSVTRGLKALSQQHNCTLFMTILAGFQALLARYSGRDDIVVGTVVANRRRPELEGLIGFFANTLVLRADLSGDPSFRAMLERARAVALEAFGHQDLPFEKLVEELQPTRDRSYHPLFQVMLVLQNVPMAQHSAGLEVTTSEIDTGSALFDLMLSLTEADDGITGYFQYSTDLFQAETVARMIKHLESLLEHAVRDPETRLSRLGLVGEEERKQLVVEWNRTEREYAKEVTWVQLFEGQVQKSPEGTALVVGEQRLSYEQLNRRVNQLAHHLRRLGVGTEELVGICAERSVEMVVAILGVLKAGGAYLPMDPGYPGERLSFMLEDARVRVVLTQGKTGRPWPEEVKVVDLEELDVSAEPRENPAVLSKPENLAYVIYTSGSTGQPKGVAIEHRSLNAFAHWAQELYGAELGGVLAGTSICFDLSVFELLVPLCWGGKVILASNVLQLPELAAREEVRLINTVPSAATELVRMGAIPAGVEVINLAGEPLRQSLVEQLYGLGSVKKVYDLYGPTEDTVYSTCALRKAGGRATIGRPLSNKQVYILDEQMEPVPVGVVGQLYIGGEGLGRGYLHRKELTEQRFVENRWARRVYKTGDLARYQWDGNIEFIGRADHQVKIRGFRIELGEVETQLRGHEKVREAVVVAREENGEKRLVGYVVGEGDLSLSELKEHLKKRLPDYMVPSALVPLEKLPLTPNGKVDRKALPAPDPAAVQTEAFVAPESDLEQLLAGIWCEVLGLTRVGIHDNFFELGGHSLMITKLISRVRDGIQVELPMASVFEAPTIAELALLVEDLLIQEIDGLTDEEAAKLDQTVIGSRQ
jgi:amino acid adenylation domain-containing protein